MENVTNLTPDEKTFAVGQKIRHKDGSLGVVTAINHGLVEWKGAVYWRVSDPSALKSAENEPAPRWRKH